MFTTSSLRPSAPGREAICLDLLARNRDPVPVWTQRDVSYWQCCSVQYLLELVAIQCVLAYSPILGTSDEEAVLCIRSARSLHARVGVHTPATIAVLSS
jgi:hypothetical protein